MRRPPNDRINSSHTHATKKKKHDEPHLKDKYGAEKQNGNCSQREKRTTCKTGVRLRKDHRGKGNEVTATIGRRSGKLKKISGTI